MVKLSVSFHFVCEVKKIMATNTPPPYFPQGTLSPPDEKAMRKRRVMFYGCITLFVLGAIGGLIGLIFLIKWLV